MKNLLVIKYADTTTLYDLDEEMEVKAIVFTYKLKTDYVEVVWEYENERGEPEKLYEYCYQWETHIKELNAFCMDFGELSRCDNKKMSVQTFIF